MMNIVNRALQGNMNIQTEDSNIEVKVDDDTPQKQESVCQSETTVTKDDIEYSSQTRYPYHTENVIPPIYMSAIAQCSAYTNYAPTVSNSTSKYAVVSTEYLHNSSTFVSTATSEYQRHYQTSPPSIDKAPSFLSRSVRKTSDGDNHSNGTTSPSTTPPEDKHVWSKAEVELLLDLYETYKEQLKDPRVRKTKVWEDVARMIRERLDSDVNGCQCNQKFRNLKADFQKVLEHNGRPGNFKRVCKYYERLASILNYPSNSTFMHVHTAYPNHDPRENTDQRTHNLREVFFENGRSSPSKHAHKRKIHESLQLNGSMNGHTESYYPTKKARSNCNCECSHEMANLRETVERVNNYVIARSAHEEERLRRLEDIHREKLIAMSRFVDIFKDFIHKMT